MNVAARWVRVGRGSLVWLLLGALLMGTTPAVAAEAPPTTVAWQNAPPPGGYAPAPQHYPQGYPPPPRRQPPAVVPDWDPDAPPPDGYELDSNANWTMIYGGITLLAVSWGFSILTAGIGAEIEENEVKEKEPGERLDNIAPSDWTPLYVPVVGPFVAIGTLDAAGSGIGILVADGVMQSVGLLAIFLGAFNRKYKLVRHDGSAVLEVTPTWVGDAGGLQLRGSF